MHSPSSSIVLMLLLASLAFTSTAWDINRSSDRAACQSITSHALEGCDQNNTILVSPSTRGAFKTVQSGKLKLIPKFQRSELTYSQAVLSLPNNTG